MQPAGEISYVTPDGWVRKKLPGIDFIIVSTAADAGISPNIFISGIFQGIQILDLADQNERDNKNALRDYALIAYDHFTTQSGLKGLRIEATHKNDKALKLATIQYLIQDADRVISITGTCAESVKEAYQPIFDSAIKSLQSEKKTAHKNE